jgi:hypothetical protein
VYPLVLRTDLILKTILIDLETGTVKDEIRDAYETNHLNILVIEDFGYILNFDQRDLARRSCKDLLTNGQGSVDKLH